MATDPQQQLAYAKLTADLLQHQQLENEALRVHSKRRWHLFFIGLIFFVFSKFVMLKTEFRPVFDLFASGGDTAQFNCLYSNAARPWNIVLNVAYPWLGKYQEQPLSQDGAQFLWDAIRGNFIPTQDDIDQSATTQNLNLHPLDYMCGDILSVYAQAHGWDQATALQNVQNDPGSSPWSFFLTKDSDLIKNGGEDLRQFLTQGFWGAVKWVGTKGSPQQIYSFIFKQTAPAPGCDNTMRFASVASSAATFSMAGAALGPEGAVAGAVFGLGLGLFTPTSGCGGSGGGSACTIM